MARPHLERRIVVRSHVVGPNMVRQRLGRANVEWLRVGRRHVVGTNVERTNVERTDMVVG